MWAATDTEQTVGQDDEVVPHHDHPHEGDGVIALGIVHRCVERNLDRVPFGRLQIQARDPRGGLFP